MPNKTPTFTIHDILQAEINLAPLICLHCNEIGEVTYHPEVQDAYCEMCGNWQLDKKEN